MNSMMSRQEMSAESVLRKDAFTQVGDPLPDCLIRAQGGTSEPVSSEQNLLELCALTKLAVGQSDRVLAEGACLQVGLRYHLLKPLTQSLALIKGGYEVDTGMSRLLARDTPNFLGEIAECLLVTEEFKPCSSHVLRCLALSDYPRAYHVASKLLQNPGLLKEADRGRCQRILDNVDAHKDDIPNISRVSDAEARELARLFEISRIALFSRESGKVHEAIAQLAKEELRIAAPLLVVVARTEGREFQIAALERLQAIAPDIAKLLPREPKKFLPRVPDIGNWDWLKLPDRDG